MAGYERFYVQCTLRKGNTYQAAWIPEKYAVVGQYLELEDGGQRNNGWQVLSTGVRQWESFVREHSRDYLLTRRASDI